MANSFSYGLNVSSKEYDGKNKYIRITDIDDNSHKLIEKSLTSPNTNLEDISDYQLKENDLLLARTGASVGKSYLYDNTDGKAFFAGFLIRVKLNKKFDENFVFQNTLTNKYQQFVKVTSQRSGQPGINAKEYSMFKINVPKYFDEQKQIGNLLKKLDNTFELQQDKISLYVQLKEKILCGIFPSNGYSESQIQFTKFHDEWKERKLEDVCTTYSGGTPKVNNNDFYNGHIPFIRSAEINKCKTELFITKLGLDNSSAKLVKKGDILYALYGATSGTVGISKINGAINQAILAIHPQKEYDSEYIAQWLKLNKQKIVRTYLQGGQGNLSASIIKKISIPFPSKEQQVAIGKLLSNLDRNISEYKERMNELISLKKFLLQRLFI
jgi:type I restriction enzyme S subunit